MGKIVFSELTRAMEPDYGTCAIDDCEGETDSPDVHAVCDNCDDEGYAVCEDCGIPVVYDNDVDEQRCNECNGGHR